MKIFLCNLFLIKTFLLVGIFNTYAQMPEFRHYETNNGLNNNTVYDIIQDNKGFMWIATKDGVNKFDGVKFMNVPIVNNKKLTNNISTSLCLFEDFEKDLWLGTEQGLFLLDSTRDTFVLYSTFLQKQITSIVEDTTKKLLFVSCENLLFQVEKINNKITFIDMADNAYALSANDGNIWMANFTGYIVKYNPQKKTAEKYDVFSHSSPPVSTSIEKTYFFNDSILLIGTTNQGVKIFNINTKKYKDILSRGPSAEDLYVRDFLKINDNQFWIATEKGIFSYNLQKDTYEYFSKNNDIPHGLSDNAVYCLYKDVEGGIWAGTYFGGINYSPKRYTNFEKIIQSDKTHFFSDLIVREIVEDKNGNLWIGTEDNGLTMLNPQNDQFTHYLPNKKNKSISSTNIHGLLAIDNELWVGTFDQGLDVIDINTGRIIKHYNYGSKEDDLKSNFIHSLIKDYNKNIFIGTSNGLYIYNKSENNFYQLKNLPKNAFYSAFFTDEENNVWAGTFTQGLYVINKEKNIVRRIKFPNAYDNDILYSKKITDIFQDSYQNIWIATESGLFRYNIHSNYYKEFSKIDGLPSNLIYSTREDNNHTLWVSTSKGLISINLSDYKITTYDTNKGILFDQFNYKSSYKDKQGFLYFGGIKGLIKFKPENFIKDTFQPPLYITSLEIANGKNIPITNSKKILLKYFESSFKIDFASLEYSSPKSIKYAYKLENIENDWNFINTNRSVYYTNLSPGKYTFKVRSSNADGNWMNNQTSIEIIIIPPVWRSNIAYIIYFLLFFFIVFFVYKFISSRQKEKLQLKKIEEEKNFYEAKINFFTQVAHEIRTPLTLIKGPLEKIIKSKEMPVSMEKNIKIMDRNTERLLNLTNDLLNFRESEVTKFSLNFKRINFNTLLNEIIARFQTAIEQKALQLNITELQKDITTFADEEALTKIISNLINNALKYSDNKIEIFLYKDTTEENIILQINNDGTTVPEEMKDKIFEPFFKYKNIKETGSGIGLALAKTLTELHNGKLTYEVVEKNINSFKLIIPLKK